MVNRVRHVGVIGAIGAIGFFAGLFFLTQPGKAQGSSKRVPISVPDPPAPSILPPNVPWSGKSLELLLPKEDSRATPFEKSGGIESPGHAETIEWVKGLVARTDVLEMVTLGTSPEGRDIVMVIGSEQRVFTPKALAAEGKATVFAHSGIHAGEIDGKDAGLMLLRDIAEGKKRDILSRANFLFVPIFNVDGHERRSRYGRINQRGPHEMGWRTTARNLNLNRDYAKIDTPEMKIMLEALQIWRPDLYLDLHVTDGADYQYDITYGYTGTHGYSPNIARWLDDNLKPAVDRDLKSQGHIPGPLVFATDAAEMTKGIFGWTASPRFSNGYGDTIHLPTVLVENHSLKPYLQRVLGTYVFLESALRTAGRDVASLREAISADRSSRRKTVPLSFQVAQEPPPKVEFLGIESRMRHSVAAGGDVVEWTGKPVTLEVPYFVAKQPKLVVDRPAAYWIPPVWTEVLDRLRWHGVELLTITRPRQVNVEVSRLTRPELASSAFEGRVRVSSPVEVETRTMTYPTGSVRVSTDQPLGDLVILLLEPQAEDSFFQWGFFLETLTRTEYVESYVMGPTGDRMLEEDPELKQEFEAKLAAEPEFRDSPRRRLQWLYSRTPFYDDHWRIYPVGRER